jgi:hypothetical protein
VRDVTPTHPQEHTIITIITISRLLAQSQIIQKTGLSYLLQKLSSKLAMLLSASMDELVHWTAVHQACNTPWSTDELVHWPSPIKLASLRGRTHPNSPSEVFKLLPGECLRQHISRVIFATYMLIMQNIFVVIIPHEITMNFNVLDVLGIRI